MNQLNMKNVSIEIPAELFVAIYARHQDKTQERINQVLESLTRSRKGRAMIDQHRSAMITRPGPNTETGKVWRIADKMLKETGSVNREAVVLASRKAKINFNTANTAYTNWKKAQELVA